MAGKDYLSRDAVAEWLVNLQHDGTLARYADIEGADALRRLFSKYAYPRWEDRPDYIFRSEFFKKVITGQTVKALAPFRPLFRRQLDQLNRVDSIMENLMMLVEVYDLTNDLDGRMINALLARRPSAGDLTDDAYRAAYREFSTRDERRRQTDMILDLGVYAKRTVDSGGFVETLVRTFPTIPVFKNNYLVRGVNETVGMARAAYRAAKQSSGNLPRYIETIREREYAFIDSIMKDS